MVTCQPTGRYTLKGFSLIMKTLDVNQIDFLYFRGTRQKRYESIEKMLDLLDVCTKIGPRFPTDAMFLDPNDSEWDDDMTYLYVEYPLYK